MDTEAARKFARKHVWDKKAPQDAVDYAEALCEQYGLHPHLGHVNLISRNVNVGTKKKPQYETIWKPYITRDGLLHAGHLMGKPFGIVFGLPQRMTNPYTDEEDVYLAAVLTIEGTPPLEGGLWVSEYDTGFNTWVSNKATMHAKVVEVFLYRRGFDISLPTIEECEKNNAEELVSNNGTSDPPPPEAQEPKAQEISLAARVVFDEAVTVVKAIGGETLVKAWLRERGCSSLAAADMATLEECLDDMRHQSAMRTTAPDKSGEAPAPELEPAGESREPKRNYF